MDRAVELLDYYAENPPEHIVLGAVYLKRTTKHAPSGNPSHDVRELSRLLGQPEPIPAHLREMAEWAAANSPNEALNSHGEYSRDRRDREYRGTQGRA